MLSLLALVACVNDTPDIDPEVVRTAPDIGAQALRNPQHPTGSNSIVEIDGFVFTLNPDAGTLTRVHPDGSMQEMDLGVEPSRMAAAGHDLYVTLRGERSVLKVNAMAFGRIVERVEVGAEPVGVVAREDGKRIYVAVSMEEAVVELDAELNELTRFSAPGEPKYLALHPSGARLYVGLARGNAGVQVIDLVDGTSSKLPLPGTTRGEVELDVRVSGDPAVSPDGTKVVVPVLYADTERPIPAIGAPEEVVPPEPFQEMPYGGKSDSIGRVTPALVEVDVDAEGRADDEEPRALFVGLNEFGEVAFDSLIDSGGRSATGYISNVVVSPDSETYLASMEGASLVALVDPDTQVFSGGGFFPDVDGFMDPSLGGLPFGEFFPPDANGFSMVAAAGMRAGAGVSGAVFTDQGAVANSAFDAALSDLDLALADDNLQQSIDVQFNVGEMAPALRHRAVTASVLSDQVELGRRLFFSTKNPSMGAGGVSCSTCHVDGRTDGFTWTFEDGPRQTPSLAGRVSDTAPVTWRSDVASVRDEADITTRGRMGGQGLTDTELDAVAVFVDWTRLPDTPLQGMVDESIERGALLYAQRCLDCHGGSALTDNEHHAMRGVDALNTPSLRGVSASAPYLHDGSARTLREVLEVAQRGEMGPAAGLSETDMLDLERYLRTL